MDEDGNDILRLLQFKDEPTILEEEDQALFLRAQSQVNRVHAANSRQRKIQRANLNFLESLLQEQQPVHGMEVQDIDGPDQPVVVERPILHSKLRISSQEKHELISRGVEIRTGPYTLNEDKLIVKNLCDFMKKYHVSDVGSILSSSRQNTVYRNFRKEHNFYACLGIGLDERPLASVLNRARCLLKNPEKILAKRPRGASLKFDIITKRVRTVFNSSCTNFSQVGTSIEENLRRLACVGKSPTKSMSKSKPKVRSKSKNPPQVLIDIVNKSSSEIEENPVPKNVVDKSRRPINKLVRKKSLKTQHLKQRKPRNSCWNKEDEDILVNVMMKMIGRERMLIPLFDFSWKSIALSVPGKSAVQCKKHWVKSLYWSWESRETLKWSEENCALLIFVMHKEMVEKEHLIDWDIIFEYFRSMVPSFGRLKIYWDDLKCLVPNYVKKDHEDIVLYLFNNFLPEFLNKCHSTMSDLQDKVDSLCSST